MLEPDEVEVIARKRMLKDFMDEIISICEDHNPRMADAIEDGMEDYLDEAVNQCQRQDDVDALIDCIETTKRKHRTRLRTNLKQL